MRGTPLISLVVVQEAAAGGQESVLLNELFFTSTYKKVPRRTSNAYKYHLLVFLF